MADESVVVEFYLKPVLMGFKSKEAGREVYEDVVYIRKRLRGQAKADEFCRKATEQDFDEYADEYKAFKRKKAVAQKGTPIEHLGVGPSMVEMLKSVEVHTIEQMAAVSDAIIQNMGVGARNMRDAAKEFILRNDNRVTELEKKLKAAEQKIKVLTTDNNRLRKAQQDEGATEVKLKPVPGLARQIPREPLAHADTN